MAKGGAETEVWGPVGRGTPAGLLWRKGRALSLLWLQGVFISVEATKMEASLPISSAWLREVGESLTSGHRCSFNYGAQSPGEVMMVNISPWGALQERAIA